MAHLPARRPSALPLVQPTGAPSDAAADPRGADARHYLIGDIAALTGLTPHALRAWERVGLLAPRRSPGGVRQYTDDELARVRLIIRTQRTQRVSRRALAEMLRSGELRPGPTDYVSGRLRPARASGIPAPASPSELSAAIVPTRDHDLAHLLVADEAQRYRRLFDAAARVAAAVVSGAPLGEVLTAICRETCTAFGVADTMLWLLDPAPSSPVCQTHPDAATAPFELRIAAAYGPRAATMLRARRHLRMGRGSWLALWNHMRRSQQAIIVQPRYNFASRTTRPRNGMPPLAAELLVVPLTVPSGETLGALALREEQGTGRFTEDDSGRAQLFATQAALAIEHARRNDDLDALLGGIAAGHASAAEQRHLRRESSLVAVQRAAAGAPGQGEIAARAERVLGVLAQTAGLPVLTASLHMLDDAGQRLRRSGVYGANLASRADIPLDGDEDSPGRALLERAHFSAATGAPPPWYDDMQRHLWPRTGIRAWAAVPLRAAAGALGALTIGLGAPLVWTEAERAWIAACADTVALALENDRLFAAERERAEALKAVLDGVDAGITLVDASGRITMRNAAAATLTARPAALAGLAGAERHDLRDAHSGAPATPETSPVARALHGEPVRAARLLMRDGQGRDRVMLASSNPVRDPRGTATGAVTIFHDITEQERRARLYERLFSQMGASLEPDAEMRVLADALVEEGGFAAAAIYATAPGGQQLDLIAARNYPDALLPLAQRIPRNAETLSAQALRSGQPQIVARWHGDTAAEGLALARSMAEFTRTGGVAALPLLARGAVAGVLVVIVRQPAMLLDDDIALAQEVAGRAALALDNAQLYQRVRATAAQLDAIINAMAEGVWVCDTAGQLTLVNAAAHDLFGLPPSEAPRSLDEFGRNLQPRWPDGRPMAPEDSPLSRGLRGEVSTGFEGTLRQAGTGRDLALQLSYAPVRDDAGTITGAVSVGRDVTTLRELERARQDFLAIASHEMKTPLTTLLGFAQLIRRRHAQMVSARATADQPSPDAAAADAADGTWWRKESDLLARIEYQARKLDRLVSDLLDDVRIQQGRLEYHWAEGDVAGAVAEAVDEQRASHPDRQITLRVPEEPLMARLDADRIGQVVTNLLTNALKYSRAEEPVEVRVASERAPAGEQAGEQMEAIVRVRDRGPGIPAEHVGQVFERFYRVPGVEVRSGSGIGLGVGLHVAQSVVERHGGRIWVEEPANPGATFAFTIPLLAPPAPGS